MATAFWHFLVHLSTSYPTPNSRKAEEKGGLHSASRLLTQDYVVSFTNPLSPVLLKKGALGSQAGTTCGKQLARTNKIDEDQEVSQGVLSRSETVLNPQSFVLNSG